MTKRQAGVIIVLLSIIALALTVGLGYYIGWGGDDRVAGSTEGMTTPAPASESPDQQGDEAEPAALGLDESIAMLEAAGLNVIRGAPVPEAPERWGDFELEESWDGRLRVFESADPEPITGHDGGVFPASMNNCGAGMYFVTFRSANPYATLDAQLINAVGAAEASEQLKNGWMLGTNCQTPTFGFHRSTNEANTADVVYTVHEYLQSSVAAPAAGPAAPGPRVPTAAPVQPAEPALVECLTGLSTMGRFSDGSVRSDQRCFDPVAVEAEGVCGGLYGHERVSRERYIELCGVPAPSG